MAVVATLYSLSHLIRRTRDKHMVDIEKISLIPDIKNTPATPLDSDNVENFNNAEGRAILDAVEKYNGDVPLSQAVVLAGGATSYYLDTSATSTDWNNSDHRIENIQYPLLSVGVVSSENPNNWMDKNDYLQTLDPTTGRPIVKFFGEVPSGNWGLFFIRPHVFDIGRDEMSIPRNHWEAIAYLAASKMLTLAAGLSSGFGDRPGGYENKDMSGVRQRYVDQASLYEQKYKEEIEGDMPVLAPLWVDWDMDSTSGPRSFHPPSLY